MQKTIQKGQNIVWPLAVEFWHHIKSGAGNETRTRDPNLGKVVLYQLSYSRETADTLRAPCRGEECGALIAQGPTRMEARGIEPLTS